MSRKAEINGSLDTYTDDEDSLHVVVTPHYAPTLHLKVIRRRSHRLTVYTVKNVKSRGWYTDHKSEKAAEQAALSKGIKFLKAYSIDRNQVTRCM